MTRDDDFAIDPSLLPNDDAAPAPAPPEKQAPPPDPEPEPEKRDYQPAPVVTHVPAGCPRCGGLRRKVLNTYTYPRRTLRIGARRWPGRTCRPTWSRPARDRTWRSTVCTSGRVPAAS